MMVETYLSMMSCREALSQFLEEAICLAGERAHRLQQIGTGGLLDISLRMNH